MNNQNIITACKRLIQDIAVTKHNFANLERDIERVQEFLQNLKAQAEAEIILRGGEG